LVAAIAVACLASLATACGSSSPSAPPNAASTPRHAAVAYAECMRSSRVRNWPDPNSNGTFDKTKLTLQALGVSASRLAAAQATCRHLAPNGGQPPNQSQLEQARAQALSYSRCVRTHGVSNFPDPASSGRIPDPATVGIDQGSPAFESANQACGKYRPPYMPSNAAYNSWARTHGSG
jgi:hypothetical protein